MNEEFWKKVEILLNELRGKMDITAPQTDRMFELYNSLYPKNQEHGKSCGSCRSRVYKNLRIAYENYSKNK